MNARRIALPALALAALLAAACATLRVDVDVYKGALADHEDIQAERMAVMAIGAKPLLIELRDRLENLRRAAKHPALSAPEKSARAIEIGPQLDWYKAGYIAVNATPEAFATWQTLIDTEAQRANAVLGLYEDVMNQDVAQFLRKAEGHHRVAQINRDLLEGAAMADAYARLQNNFRSERPNNDIEAYIKAYGEYFSKALLPKNIPNLYTPPKGERYSLEQQTLYLSRLLDDPRTVRNHADILFDDSHAADRQAFVNLVQQRAQAFMAMHRAMDELFTGCLMFLRDINQTPSRFRIANKDALNAALARVAGSTLRALGLADIKDDCQGPGSCGKIQPLLAAIPPGRQASSIQQAVVAQLYLDPAATSEQLLAAHLMAKKGQFPRIGADPAAVQFGLSLAYMKGQASAEAAGNSVDLLGVGGELDSLRQRCPATGLERGRGEWGLETLIEKYLDAAQDFTARRCGQADPASAASDCDAVRARLDTQRGLLREELVRFAEKVLVIANNEVLLTQYAADGNEPNAKIVDNIQVLQAVANSILNQANELILRQEHRGVLAQRLPGLKNTLEETYAPGGRRTLALVVQQLAAERAALAASLARSAEAAKETQKELAKQKAAQEAKTNEATGLAAKRSAFKPAEDFKAALAAAAAQAKAMLGHGDALKTLAVFKPYAALAPDKVAGMTGYTASVQAAGTYLAQVPAELEALNAKLQALGGAATSLQLAALQDEAQSVRDAHGAAQGVAKTAAGLPALLGKAGAGLAEPAALHKGAADCYALYVANQGWPDNDTCKPFNNAPGLAKALAGLAESQLLAALGDLQGSLSSNATALAAAWSPAIATRLAELDKAAQNAKQEAAAAGTKVEELTQASGAAAQPDASGQATLANLDAAIRTVDAIRATWLEKTPAESPQEVVSSLLKLLGTRAQDDQDCAATLGVVGARRFDFPALGAPSRAIDARRDPRLALDQLLDSLHLILAQEVKAGGAQSETAARTREAIAVVEAQRSGLIFLQPASAFLRSSYPATSIQPNFDKPGWQNTLVNNFFRSFPVLGGLRGTNEARKLKVFAEIDRQSWQTVNTVRLEGAGRTNYAIAKDDIGNWYAKAYSTDPSDIIKGARSLAMFSLNMPPAAVSDTLARAQAPTGDGAPAKQQTSLEKLLGQYAARYAQNSKAQAEDLAGWLKSGNAASLIQEAWAADSLVEPFLDDLQPALPAAAKVEDLPAQAAKLPTDPAQADYGGFILAGLKAVKRYAAALDSKLASQPLSDAVRDAYATAKNVAETEKEAVTKEAFAQAVSRARDTARTMLRNAIAQRLGQRQDTVDEYFRAAGFIGQAAGVSTPTE